MYEELASDVLSVLEELGQKVVLRKHREDVWCEYENEYGREVCRDQYGNEVTELFEDYEGLGAVGRYSLRVVDGESIMRNDKRAICARIPAPVPQKDKLVIGGQEYTIVDSESVSPAGVDVCYEVQAR